MIEVVEIWPDTALAVTALHYCEDVHEEKEKERDPPHDGVVQSEVERREHRKHCYVVKEVLATPNQYMTREFYSKRYRILLRSFSSRLKQHMTIIWKRKLICMQQDVQHRRWIARLR